MTPIPHTAAPTPRTGERWRSIDAPAIKCRVTATHKHEGRLASVQIRRLDLPGVINIDADGFLERWEFERGAI